MITDVFFDLDHTLWDFERNSALAFAKVFETHGIALPLDVFLAHYVPLNLQYWERYRREEITQSELRYGRLKDAFNLMGYETSDELIHALSAAYITYLPENNYLFDGAVDILSYLHGKYRLHIITNGFDEVQTRKIANANIGHFFTTVTNSEMAGVKKPHPDIFHHALKRAKVDKENCVMIGDCIDADVRGALDFGMDAIWFCEQPEGVSQVKHVHRLTDLKKYL
ncbi:2-haloalkanoic acid dehalogenase [Flavobacterium longum]|uniref:YjjG family noncanonical pyrimidine nucleotidase n=1 Tax=Flavobacterium longum TaxID=1299340 RepID=UPI0039E99577